MTALLAFQDIPGLLTAVVAVIALVAAGLLGLQYGTVGFLRHRVDDLEKAIASHEKDRAEDQARIAQLQADLDALSRLKTGQDALLRLGGKLDSHVRAAEEHWSTEERFLGEIATSIRSLRG